MFSKILVLIYLTGKSQIPAPNHSSVGSGAPCETKGDRRGLIAVTLGIYPCALCWSLLLVAAAAAAILRPVSALHSIWFWY